jgi:ABC-type multidrug transport system ATPase subunit
LKIVWKKLTLTDPKTGFKILNHLDGYAESGNFITIMGPSGAGKSSLLSILACRLRDANSKLQIEGHVPFR